MRKVALGIVFTVILGAWVGMYLDWLDRSERDRTAVMECLRENREKTHLEAVEFCRVHMEPTNDAR